MKADLSSRVWFLPNGCSKRNPNEIKSWTSLLKKGNFCDWSLLKEEKFPWNKAERFPHIFLVRAPISFGHSQLVIPCPGTLETADEVDFFAWASFLVSKVISTFQTVFEKKKIHQMKQEYHKLARDTYTYGNYLKTLIVRASADEEKGKKYKIHLIPYFQSHENSCLERFRSLYRVAPHKQGGLIGWLGEREKEVDKWQIDGFPGPYSLVEIAECVWKLPQLAEELRNGWSCQQAAAGDAKKQRA